MQSMGWVSRGEGWAPNFRRIRERIEKGPSVGNIGKHCPCPLRITIGGAVGRGTLFPLHENEDKFWHFGSFDKDGAGWRFIGAAFLSVNQRYFDDKVSHSFEEHNDNGYL